MIALWKWITAGYLRLIEPVIEWCVARRISPNLITTVGTACAAAAGLLFAAGFIAVAGWTLGLTALFDLVDGAVARRTGRATAFGAFYDSTMDRVADGFLFGGLAWFFANAPAFRSGMMVAVTLVALVATLLTSYARARAEAIGVGMKGVGIIERPGRIVLLAAPQAFFGLAFDGWILRGVVILLGTTALLTVVQRVRHVAIILSHDADEGGVP